jgi:hypothetical protein
VNLQVQTPIAAKPPSSTPQSFLIHFSPSLPFPFLSSHLTITNPRRWDRQSDTRVCAPGVAPPKHWKCFSFPFHFPLPFFRYFFIFLFSAGLHQERKGKAKNKNRFMVLVLVIVMARPPPVYYPQFFLERFFFFGFRCRRR